MRMRLDLACKEAFFFYKYIFQLSFDIFSNCLLINCQGSLLGDIGRVAPRMLFLGVERVYKRVMRRALNIWCSAVQRINNNASKSSMSKVMMFLFFHSISNLFNGFKLLENVVISNYVHFPFKYGYFGLVTLVNYMPRFSLG